MSRNEIILGLVALVLVVFSLVVSLVIPRRNPGFPGQGIGVFTAVAILLVVGMLATVEVVGAEHEEEAEAAEVGETEGRAAGESPGEPPGPAGDPAAGKEIFASAGCGSCHTLADAGSSGMVGPNLDDSRPPYELVIDRVTNGRGQMPSFADQLSEEQIQDVAAYVVQATSG